MVAMAAALMSSGSTYACQARPSIAKKQMYIKDTKEHCLSGFSFERLGRRIDRRLNLEGLTPRFQPEYISLGSVAFAWLHFPIHTGVHCLLLLSIHMAEEDCSRFPAKDRVIRVNIIGSQFFTAAQVPS